MIIGAGAAGLAAADVLERRGIPVTLLEARNRTGGRIWTARAGVDLGASWIHGVKGNPVTALARAAGAVTRPFDYDDIERFATEGGPLAPEASDLADELFERLLARVARRQETAESDSALSTAVSAFRRSIPAADHPLLDYAVRTGLIHEYAADPARLSLPWFDAAEDFPGGDAVFPNGYADIFRALRPPRQLLTGQTVREIDWTGDIVRVTTDRSEHRARAVLVTLPLGVLKRGSVRFVPGLPDAKTRAIARLGVGTLNKLVLVFPRVFWPEDTALFGRVSDGSGEWEEWVNLFPVAGQPALMGFNAGSCAERLETWSEKALVASAFAALRRMFGDQIPEPVEAFPTRWAADPFAGGSYSHFAPGSSPADPARLAEPVGGSLFFAGEACSPTHPSTVQGAILTGRRAAAALASVV